MTTVTPVWANPERTPLSLEDLRNLGPRIAAVLVDTGAVALSVEDVTVDSFARYRDLLIEQPGDYHEAATPRSKFADGVWSATDLPASQGLDTHNESSYRTSWPGRILFGCEVAPERGGETLLTDVGQLVNEIPSEILKEFRSRGWALVRNYHEGIGRTWQDAFSTQDKAAVARYCRANELEFEWREGDVLRTKQVRPATTRHPVTSQELWFNHIAFWHTSALPPHVRLYMEDEFGRDGLPFSTYFGDGAEIPDDVMSQIRSAYDRVTIAHAWEEGSLVLLDNMRIAHGRRPFAGRRSILVAMGNDVSRASVSSNNREAGI